MAFEMRARFLACLATGAFLVVASTVALAETPPKVWTNEDLERMFGPSEPTPEIVNAPGDGTAQWDAVESFLERQYRRIEQEKDRELKRDEIRAAYAPQEPTYALGVAPLVGTGWWWPGYGCGVGPGTPGIGWRPEPSPHRDRHRHGQPVPSGFSKSARQVNPAGRAVSSSARSVNPATSR